MWPNGDCACRWRNSKLRRGGRGELGTCSLSNVKNFSNGMRRLVKVVGSIEAYY